MRRNLKIAHFANWIIMETKEIILNRAKEIEMFETNLGREMTEIECVIFKCGFSRGVACAIACCGVGPCARTL